MFSSKKPAPDGIPVHKLSNQDKKFIESMRSWSTDDAEKLLKAGASINCQDENGMTPLMHAVNGNNFRMVEFLLNHRANVYLADKNGRTALMYAVCRGSPFSHMEFSSDSRPIAHLLLNRGSNANAKDNEGKSVLQMAGNDKMRELLKKHNARE